MKTFIGEPEIRVDLSFFDSSNPSYTLTFLDGLVRCLNIGVKNRVIGKGREKREKHRPNEIGKTL